MTKTYILNYQNWLPDGIFSGSEILVIGIFILRVDQKIPEIPISRESRESRDFNPQDLGFLSPGLTQNFQNQFKIPVIQESSRSFTFGSGFFSGMGYPDKKPTLINYVESCKFVEINFRLQICCKIYGVIWRLECARIQRVFFGRGMSSSV